MKKILTACLFAAAVASAAPLPTDPRERNFKLMVDGAEVAGVVGYRIEFARNPMSKDDQRRLGVAYSPDQRRLLITVTQKGLNQLQDWLNSATDTSTPASKTISIQAKNNQDQLLARWDLSGVVPSTFSSSAAGTIDEVDSTVEFLFDRLRLVEASAK
ncbi:MAG: phage tail protein [Acidobacteria bacterium]|nr:phage tail protein [Acidobacteriota bacterium]